MPKLPAEAYAIIEGRHSDPFHYLGLHPEGGKSVVRAFLPEATNVEAVGEHGEVAKLDRVHASGLFIGALPNGSKRYQLRARFGDNIVEFEDAYRFPPILTDFDLYLLGEGTHQRLYDKLGAHPMRLEGVDGIGFVVLAPNARRVSVVGDFNFWDGAAPSDAGTWCRLLGAVHPARQGRRPLQVRDHRAARPPVAAEVRSDGLCERGAAEDGVDRVRRGTSARARARRRMASTRSRRRCRSTRSISARGGARTAANGSPIASWPSSCRPMPATWASPISNSCRSASIRSTAPGAISRPASLRRPAASARRRISPRWSTPAIAAGIGVLLDWVPGHFPDDPHGLGRFDGTALYEHADPRQGLHLDWDTLIYNYGRTEVTNFLIVERAVLARALPHRRPARRCGRLDALSRLQPPAGRLDSEPAMAAARTSRRSRSCAASTPSCSRASRSATTVAEESTAWPLVSRPVDVGGLGFGYKWNMGWMHDTLNYISKDPIHRKHHHDDILFGLLYAFSENFILPLSARRGRARQALAPRPHARRRLAALRQSARLLRLHVGHPGKKLLFMGGEFAPGAANGITTSRSTGTCSNTSTIPASSGWSAISTGSIARCRRCTRWIATRRGFEWLITDDANRSVFAWLRKGFDRARTVSRGHQLHAQRRSQLSRPRALRRQVERGVQHRLRPLWRQQCRERRRAFMPLAAQAPELRLTVPPLAAIFLVPES